MTLLPSNGVYQPGYGVAVDSTGDLFVADFDHNRAVELPKTPTGYGPQITLPLSGDLSFPWGIAVDGAGDVFSAGYDFIDNPQVVELPKTATGYGPETALPVGVADLPSPRTSRGQRGGCVRPASRRGA